MTSRLRRRLTVAATLTTAALALSACGSAAGGAPEADETGPQTVEIVWKGDATRAAAIEAALDLYREKNPDVTIKTDFQSGDEYLQKLAIRFASNDAPDLMRQERDSLRDYSDRGTLLDLHTVEDEIDFDSIPDTILGAGEVGGKLYGLVGGITSWSMGVNTALFEEYGVEVPDLEEWSWDDYIDSAAELTKASGGAVWGTDFPVGDISSMGIFLRQQGEDLWDEDGEPAFTEATATEWFELWQEAKDAGATPPGGAIDVLGAAADQSALGRGVVASTIIPTNAYASYDATLGGGLEIAYFPGEATAKQRGQQIIPSMFWSISASSKSPKTTASILDFLVNDVEANKLLGGTHGQPANPKVAEAVAEDLSADDQASFAHLIQLSEEDLTAPIPDPAGAAELRSELTTIGDQVTFGQITPAEAAKQFLAAAESTLGS